jgi:hypothetical protein
MTNSASQRMQERCTEQAELAINRGNRASDALSNAVLAEQCHLELKASRRGEPYDEAYVLELFRRATVECDQEAWQWMQHCFSEIVLGWLRHHPNRALASRLESEENVVVLTFERFRQVTTLSQHVSIRTLPDALQYLRTSLNGVVLDILRTYSRAKEVPLLEQGESGEPFAEEQTEGSQVREILQSILSNRREQRLAYLLYHCGLLPREIVRFCPQEFSSVEEIYRLRRIIFERLVRNADTTHWQLSPREPWEEGWL